MFAKIGNCCILRVNLKTDTMILIPILIIGALGIYALYLINQNANLRRMQKDIFEEIRKHPSGDNIIFHILEKWEDN